MRLAIDLTQTRLASPRGLAAAAVLVLCLDALAASAHEQEFGDAQPGTGHSGAPVVPIDGKALDFPAQEVVLLSWLSSEDLSGEVQLTNDVWGYVSPAGREYAIVGLEKGTAFVEVSDPLEPRVVKIIPGAQSAWRDMAVYKNYAYSVTEGGGGLQVIDLSRIDKGKVRLRRSIVQRGLSTVHNISVNEDSGFAYLSGTNLANGGLVMANLANPAKPRILKSTWPFHYVHDCQAVTFTKGLRAGREIVFASAAESGLQIIDVTDKKNLFTVATLTYPGLAYSHSSWLGRKGHFLYLNDELDELRSPEVTSSTTHIFKVKSLENARYLRSYTNGQTSIDHNNMAVGKRLYQSNYASGLRVFDLSKRRKPREVGFFDTSPEHDTPEFNGAWGVYAALPSGLVLVSDIQRGLFVFLPPE